MGKREAMLALLAALIGHTVDHNWRSLEKLKEAQDNAIQAGCTPAQLKRVEDDAKSYDLFGR